MEPVHGGGRPAPMAGVVRGVSPALPRWRGAQIRARRGRRTGGWRRGEDGSLDLTPSLGKWRHGEGRRVHGRHVPAAAREGDWGGAWPTPALQLLLLCPPLSILGGRGEVPREGDILGGGVGERHHQN
jgi:hypothetical protein